MTNDMKANLRRLRSVIGADQTTEHHDLTSAFIDLYANDVKLRWQGRDWPWGGDMEGRDKLLACMQATGSVLAGPPDFWESNFWILDQERLLWWWRSRGSTLRGEKMSNSGVTILRYDRDRICEHWEYTDTQYLAHMFRGWRDLVDPAVGQKLANWANEGTSAYPKTDDHT